MELLVPLNEMLLEHSGRAAGHVLPSGGGRQLMQLLNGDDQNW